MIDSILKTTFRNKKIFKGNLRKITSHLYAHITVVLASVLIKWALCCWLGFMLANCITVDLKTIVQYFQYMQQVNHIVLFQRFYLNK